MASDDDNDALERMADKLQGDDFFNLVIDDMERRMGRKFSPAEREHHLNDLRKNTRVAIGPSPTER